MTPAAELLALVDLDLLRAEAADARVTSRMRKLGFSFPDVAPLDRERGARLGALDRRWLSHYERARTRYGRGLALVRSRVCQGCHITLPTSAMPPEGQPLTTCESCGRLLYWR